MTAALVLAAATLASGVEFVSYRDPNVVYERDLLLMPSYDGVDGEHYIYFPVTDPGPIRVDIRGDLYTAKGEKISAKGIPYTVSAIVKDADDKPVFNRKFGDLSLQATFLATGRMSNYYVPNSPDPAGDWRPNTPAKWSAWKLMLFAPASPLGFRGKLRMTAPAYGYELVDNQRVDQGKNDLGIMRGEFSTKNPGYYEITAEYVFDATPNALPIPCTLAVTFGSDAKPTKTQIKAGANRLYLRSVAGGEHPNVKVTATIVQKVPRYHCRLRIRRFPFRPQQITSSGAAFETAGP